MNSTSPRAPGRTDSYAPADPFFIFDVQLHYVSAKYDPNDAEATRKGGIPKGAPLLQR